MNKKLFCLIALLLSANVFLSAYSQTFDLVEYFRLDDPPQTALYAGRGSDGSTYVQEYQYNPNVSFNGQQTLRIDEFTGDTSPDSLEQVSYFSFTDSSVLVHAIQVEIEDLPVGLVQITPSQPLAFNRFPAVSVQDQQSSTAATSPNLGEVNVTQSFTVISTETIEVPYGQFEDCLVVQRISTLVSALGSLNQTENFWVHPSVGVVRWESVTDGYTEELVSITPEPAGPTPTVTPTTAPAMPTSTSTPIAAFSPTPTQAPGEAITPFVSYEFDQDSLKANGWSSPSGGFGGAISPGQASVVQLPQGTFASSSDQRGLALTVQSNQAVFMFSNQAIQTGGKPVLIRAVVRSNDPNSTFALVALKGNVAANDVDGSIATHIPANTNGFLTEESSIVLLYQPDSGEIVTPAIQLAGHTTLTAEAVVWIDRFEVYVLEREDTYPGDLFFAK